MAAGKMQSGELVLIRHAPIVERGRLCGRTDVAATIDARAIAALMPALPSVERIVASPALRCRQTATALWPDRDPSFDERLWEQDFGEHDGRAFDELPDLGRMSNAELARYAAPGGESFADLCRRAWPAIGELASEAAESADRIALVVHAGIIRAALGLTLEHGPAGLSFEVDNLSVTRVRTGPDGPISIIDVNVKCRPTD